MVRIMRNNEVYEMLTTLFIKWHQSPFSAWIVLRVLRRTFLFMVLHNQQGRVLSSSP